MAADYVALPSCEAVREALVQALRRGAPLAALTGEAGTGKSMLAMVAAASLQADIRHIGYLSSAPADAAEVVLHLALAFGMPLTGAARERPDHWLMCTFRERKARGESSLLIIDEAQYLSPAAWAELLFWRDRLWRRLTRLQVLAVGLPALGRFLEDPGPAVVLTQPPLVLRLAPLDGWATREFICVTLRRHGRWGDPALDAAALDMFHRHCGGVLGRIQRLASRCLQTAEIFELAAIDAEVVAQQADELGLSVGADLPSVDSNPGAQAEAVDESPLTVAAAQVPGALPAPALWWRPRPAARGSVGTVVAAVLAGLGIAAWLGWLGSSPDTGSQAAARPDPVPALAAPAALAAAAAPAEPAAAEAAPPAVDAPVQATVAEPLPRAAPVALSNPPVAKAQPRPVEGDPARRVAARSPASSPACSLILARFSLGEPLSAADLKTLNQQCR